MNGVPDALVAELAGPVARALPLVASRVPPGPAATLGRLRAVADGVTEPVRRSGRGRVVGPGAPVPLPPRADASVHDLLHSVPSRMAERLLVALELTVGEIDLAGAPDLAGLVPAPPGAFVGYAIFVGQSEAAHGVSVVEAVRPGVAPLVMTLTRRLADDPRVAALLTVDPAISDEDEVAAAHGAAWLALAVLSATAVLRSSNIEPWVATSSAVLGVAIGTAVRLLHDVPMPAGYEAALLARERADYVLPQRFSASAAVSEHRIALLEGTSVPEVDFAGNGLVTVAPDGVVVRTGVESGWMQVLVSVLDAPPPDVDTGWEEIVEVSWRAAANGAAFIWPGPSGRRPPRVTPPWPGDYRLRMHARGRDEADDEHYHLMVWGAPPAPEIVHARTDRLGHRLRGEPEPVRPERPEAGYRWLRHCGLSEAATVTVVTGAPVEEVLRAFGADPDRPESLGGIADDMMRRRSVDPWVAALEVDGAVVAVEYNGWQGSTAPVLTRASANGRAASMYWNVNALTRLSFAEDGQVLLSEEPFGDLDAPPSVAPALVDLDFDDSYRGKPRMGLVAVERFTGYGFTAEDLARIEDADIAFRIVPHLAPHYPRYPQPQGPLGPADARLAQLPEAELRDLAWWAAAEAARYAGVDTAPDIVASIADRELTLTAHQRARRSELDGGAHRMVWRALHCAANPDPVAAVVNTVDAARYAAGPHAAAFVAAAQARIASTG